MDTIDDTIKCVIHVLIVLFNSARDCNPWFHLYESLWMLAGRNDVASIAYYAKNMANYSDDGKTLNGAYGFRWRHMVARGQPWKGVDQLDILVNHLKADPTSRRAVLQMWNVEDDLLKIGFEFSNHGLRNITARFRLDNCAHARKVGAIFRRQINDKTKANQSEYLPFQCIELDPWCCSHAVRLGDPI